MKTLNQYIEALLALFHNPRHAAWIILVLSAMLHCIGLRHPNGIVFDEFYWGRFAQKYCCTHERFFDLHPPVAKLIYAAAGKASGLHSEFKFDHVNQSYENEPWPVPMRMVSAVCGTLLSLTIFIVMLQLGASVLAAFFASLVLTLDNAMIGQLRIMSLEGPLILGSFAAISCFLAAERSQSWRSRRAVLLYAAAGVFAGVAVGSKLSGLQAMGIMGVIALVKLATQRSADALRHFLGSMTVVTAGAIALYLGAWRLHYYLLDRPGDGDKFGFIPTGNFFHDIVESHKLLWSYNVNLKATHAYASPWFGWPRMTKPVLYWTSDKASIYFIGNIVVWWTAYAMICIATIGILYTLIKQARQRTGGTQPQRLWLPLAGYIIAFVPLMGIDRVLFLYHYLTPLIFSVMTAVLWLDYCGAFSHPRDSRQSAIMGSFLIAVGYGFIITCPVTFGFNWHFWSGDWIFRVFPQWR